MPKILGRIANGEKNTFVALSTNTLAENCVYDNTSSGLAATDVQDAIDELCTDVSGKVSKSGDTMSGNLTIDRQDGSQMIGGQSILTIGNNLGIDQDKNSEGLVYLYSITGKKTVLTSTADGSDKIIEFPNKGGTVALTSDFQVYKVRPVVPLVGSITGLGDRNFYLTDEKTFLEYHFCILLNNVAVGSGGNILELPTFAQNEVIQYGVCACSTDSANHAEICALLNNGNYIKSFTPITSGSNRYLIGTFRMSLI